MSQPILPPFSNGFNLLRKTFAPQCSIFFHLRADSILERQYTHVPNKFLCHLLNWANAKSNVSYKKDFELNRYTSLFFCHFYRKEHCLWFSKLILLLKERIWCSFICISNRLPVHMAHSTIQLWIAFVMLKVRAFLPSKWHKSVT